MWLGARQETRETRTGGQWAARGEGLAFQVNSTSGMGLRLCSGPPTYQPNREYGLRGGVSSSVANGLWLRRQSLKGHNYNCQLAGLLLHRLWLTRDVEAGVEPRAHHSPPAARNLVEVLRTFSRSPRGFPQVRSTSS